MLDKNNFSEKLFGIGLLFGKELNKPQLRLYYGVLSKEFKSDEEFNEACIKLMEEWAYSYMPLPAHFIQKSKLNDTDLDVISLKAYKLAKETVLEHSIYKEVKFEDEIINNVINLLGGWKKFCDIGYIGFNDEWIKRDFIKIYKNVSKSSQGVRKTSLEAYNPFLKGNPEKVYIKSNYQIPNITILDEKVLLGNNPNFKKLVEKVKMC